MKEAATRVSGIRPSLHDLSIVIPFRSDSQQRIDNLTTVIRFLAAHFEDLDVLILENGPSLVAEHLGEYPGVRWFGTLSDSRFHKTRLLNVGIEEMSTRRFAAAYDADVLAYPKGFEIALELSRGGDAIVIPFNGHAFDVRGRLRRSLIETATLESVPPDRVLGSPRDFGRGLKLLNTGSLGGIVIYDRDVFSACGAYHEDFQTWGYEDAEIVLRMEKLGHPLRRIDGFPLLHLSHRRLFFRGRWYNVIASNRKVYEATGKMTAEQLREKITAGALRARDH